MRTSVWTWPAGLLLAIWFLVACGGGTEPSIETAADPGLSSPNGLEDEADDRPGTATPSTAALEPGQVGERLCGAGAECASEFVLDGTIYALSCEAIREDAVLPGELGSGRAFAYDVVVHAVQGFEPDDVVAISVPGGYCSETDPEEIHTPWSMAFASEGSSATAGRAACQIGALSPLRAEANGCPDSSGGVWGANGSPITPLPEIESLSMEYKTCLQDLGFEPGGVQVLVNQDGRPWWVKTGNDVPAELHGPCFEQVGGKPNGLSSHGTDPTE